MEFATYADFGQLPASAGALFALCERDSLFFSRPWFENLALAARDDAQAMLLACVLDGDEVLAILPLTTHADGTLYSLRHRYTSLYSLLLADRDRQKTLGCLAQGLRALPFDSLLLEPVSDADVRLSGLRESLDDCGFDCSYSFRFYNWILKVQGRSYEDYMADRPARVRNTIERKTRKLEREYGYDIRLFAGDSVPGAMSHYHDVYRASWKANEQYPDFLNGMVAAFSAAGWSRLAILYIRGHPAAAQLWLVRHGKASIFRLAYDDDWRHFSPGSILTAFLMKHAIDVDKAEEIDFLTGNESYKQDWMSDRRERWALSCVRRRRPASKLEVLAGALKTIVRRSGLAHPSGQAAGRPA